MKTIKYTFSIILLILGLGACESNFLDVNDDPNSSVNVDPKLLFMDCVTGYATNSLDIAPPMQYWSQQMGAGSNNADVFSDPEIYRDLDGYTNSNTWYAYFDGIKSLRLAKDLAIKSENVNAVAQLDLFEALVFFHATLMWEDIPFSQAVNFDEYPIPDFDTQKTILEGIIAKIDATLATIDLASTFSMDEILYKGDMTKWQKFGNSLKLKILIFLATKEPSNTVYTNAIADIVANKPLFASTADNMAFPYFDQSGNKNPFFKLLDSYNSGKAGFFYPGKVLVDIMNTRNDPRRPIWFERGEDADPDEYIGVTPGSSISSAMSLLNPLTIIAPDAPIFLASYEEQELYIAEAIIRGWATGDAQVHFKNAIQANLNYWAVPASDITTYVNARPNVAGLPQQQALEEVWSELYIVCMLRPHEGFAHQKRNGFPTLLMPVGAQLSGFVTRWPIPNSEVTSNPNASKYKKELTTPMWIDKQ